MNELSLDMYFTLPGGIPYNRKQIFELAATSFAEPGQWNGTNVVLVPDTKKYNPLNHIGSLKRLSPEEPNFARIIGIYNAIKANSDNLDMFRIDLLCAPFQFEHHEGGIDNPNYAAIPRAINLREAAVAEAGALGRDTIQRVFEVIKTRKIMEISTGGKVSVEKTV